MPIVLQSAHVSLTVSPPVPLLPASREFVARTHRLALPAPKIAGYLPVTAGTHAGTPLQPPHAILTVPAKQEKQEKQEKRIKRVVEAEITNPLLLIDIRKDFDAWWAEFERIHGKVKTIEEMDAEIEAKVPGYLAWVARMNAKAEMEAEAVRS